MIIRAPTPYCTELKIGRYSKHDEETGSILKCGITDDWSLDSAILYAPERGVGFDSSHRNKNENFAPVTFFLTTDENDHLAPSA